MDWYPLGTPIVVPITVTDNDGAPADVSPEPSLEVLRPGGLAPTTLASTDETGNGNYQVIIQVSDLTKVGQYRVIPAVTGANAGTDFEVFEVYDPESFPRLVSDADARAVIRPIGSGDDEILSRMIGWASARVLIEYEATIRTVTQRVNVRGGDPWLKLSKTPVREIVSVVSALDASTSSPGGFVVTHPNMGVVKFAGWLDGPYDVVYKVGPDEIPVGLDGATLALLQHWWAQLIARRTSSGGVAGLIDFRGLPNTVQNMLDTVPSPRGFW